MRVGVVASVVAS